jgi:hypothetical protein
MPIGDSPRGWGECIYYFIHCASETYILAILSHAYPYVRFFFPVFRICSESSSQLFDPNSSWSSSLRNCRPAASDLRLLTRPIGLPHAPPLIVNGHDRITESPFDFSSSIPWGLGDVKICRVDGAKNRSFVLRTWRPGRSVLLEGMSLPWDLWHASQFDPATAKINTIGQHAYTGSR